MIAGRRPFGGESMEAVISAILTQKPEPIENLCPVSEGLARIIDRALAKDPNQRYSTAAELLADLESGSAAVRRTRPKWLRMNLLIGAAALVVSGASLLWSRFSAAPPPIRVAILQPEVSSHPETNSIAHEVVEAALASLLTLDGVQPLDTPERDEKSGSLSEIRRAAEADETVRPQLNCDQGWCRVTLHRQNRAREVLATVEPFEVSEGIDKADTLADAMRAHVRQLYPDRARRPDAPGAAVRPEDYSAYIELERRIDDGRLVGKQELDRVDSLLRTSPDLIGAYVLAAGIARNQGELDRALDYAARAEKIAPHDPRPLFIRLRIEVKQNRLDAAEATLGRLSSLAPGDIRVMQAEAELLEANEDLEKAHPLRQEIVRRRPIWRYVHDLAMLELSLGASEEIWEHLRDILAEQPNNVYILEDMAALETSFGDLKRAAALYEQLLRIQPTLATLTNLGFIRYILADYPAATRAYRRALTLEPDNPVTRFNLATSLEAQGNRQEAHDLYREIDHSLASPSDTHTRLLRAQCLLRSGRRDDAALLTREVLRQRPDDVQALYQAAQLYALLGDHYAASYYAKLALEQGMRREWFMIPEFSALQEDPSFRALLVGKEAHKLSS
jgi:tetratricopeptide (TPR) repeat protein